MTTCSTAQSDSMPVSSAVRARCERFSGNANGPALAYISPNFMPGAIVENASGDKPSARLGEREPAVHDDDRRASDLEMPVAALVAPPAHGDAARARHLRPCSATYTSSPAPRSP